MGTDVWIVHWKWLYGHLNSDEIDFIVQNFNESDDSTYGVSKEELEEVKAGLTAEERSKFVNLLDAIEQGLKEEGDCMSISVG